MKRREFITLLGGAAAAWSLAAHAQQPDRMRRIGVLMNLAADDAEGQARIAAFVQALQRLGWSDGATFGSTTAGQLATLVGLRDTPRNCWRSRPTSFWLRPPQASKPYNGRPAQCL